MSSRHYPFELPLNVPGWGGFRERLIRKVVDAGLWDLMPIPLLNRLVDAQTNGTGIEITKADLDSISDDVWAKVEKAIG